MSSKFRFVFQRKLGVAALLAVTLVASGVAATIAVTSAKATALDTCGYDPSAAPKPGGGTVVFNENEVTRAIAFYGVGLAGHVGVFANDESGLQVGANGTATSTGVDGQLGSTILINTTITSIPVGPPGLTQAVASGDTIVLGSQQFTASAAAAIGDSSISVGSKKTSATYSAGMNISNLDGPQSAVPPTLGTGSDASGRAIAPVIYLTDITNGASNVGDYEQSGTVANLSPFPGGSPYADGLFGSWSNTLGTKPSNTNNWKLGNGADTPPATDAFGGTTIAYNQGFGTEVAWNAAGLHARDPVTGLYVALQPGHTYRVQSITHDTDQNQNGGDVGEVCTTFHIPTPNLVVTKTADHLSPVNAGDQIGFQVEVKNTGDADATSASLGDVLPTGSGSGVTWAIASDPDNAFQLGTNGAGKQTLELKSSTLPVGADHTVHITADTSKTECSVYDNSATLSASNAPSAGPANAEENCNPADIKILKTADHASVNAGEDVGFTVTVWNIGAGDAKGVALNDPLPQNAGLSWSIDAQGNGWNNTCAINLAGTTLSCGPVTVPKNTAQIGSPYTVHITSHTTKDTAGNCLNGSGIVDNTGFVTTTNDGSGHSEDTTCVKAADIKILKTADHASVNAGEDVGFTVTVWNAGVGDAKGVELNDPLPQNAGLSWSIDSQGTDWNNTCSINLAGTTLHCGPVTVPTGTTQANSKFTVHITSHTTKDTAGNCLNGSGIVDNTGFVTTTNDGSGNSEDKTCVKKPDIQILKKADHASVNAGEDVGFTVTVWNAGVGDATGVALNDPLPQNTGLSWSIDAQGAGWNNTCSINPAGTTLSCGPVTVPANTTQANSNFTVHITSHTTKDTAGNCLNGSGIVDNTGFVTTTNDGSGNSEDKTCVKAADIQILKKADRASVNAGEDVGFTVTVWNNGVGDAKGVELNDPLPQNAGLSWSIDAQGTDWNNTCSINPAGTTLHCGPVTVPTGTTQANSKFTVHITSGTTKDTAGNCQNGSGIVDNTGFVTTTNDGSGHSEDTTCVKAADIKFLKKADKGQVNAGDDIGFTETTWNNGVGDAKGVELNDPLPQNAGLSWSIDAQGTDWNNTCSINPAGTTLHCGPVTVPTGTTQLNSKFTVHITSHTTAATGGTCPNTGVVNNTGFVTTTNDGSAQSSDTVCVAKPGIHFLKTADKAQVNAGEDIGFTQTTWNDGQGAAAGVMLDDPLPQNAGLSWSIDKQGLGWNGTCAINPAGTKLTCGPVTVPAGTAQLTSIFTVHITSHTTAATGGQCPNTGVVDNTGTVTTTNDGGDQSGDKVCVAAPIIKHLKKADKSQVNAGDDIGFTQTTWNEGQGDATGVMLDDPLPQNAGLSWSIDKQGAGWNGTCAINLAGTKLTCGPATVPTGTTQANSNFTVHITSHTTAATGGDCPNTGVVDNTGTVTTTNDGSAQSGDTVCVQQSAPAIVTTQDPATGAIGVNYKDKASLSGAVNLTGSGSITFKLYPQANCNGTPLDTETVNNISSNGTVETPNGFVLMNAGTYYWVASFSGDANNASATSGCNDEPVVVAPNSPSITTLLSTSSGNTGVTVHDSSTLSGATSDAGGTVTYSVYSDATCSTKFADAGTVNVTNGSVPNSNDVTFNKPGTYYWQASYSGDNNNKPAKSTCTDEKLVVAPLVDLSITKSGAPAVQELGQGNITWTMVVTNNGPDTDTGVKITDPMPAGNTFVSAATTQGTCTGGAILTCDIGTMAAGAKVTITLVTTPSTVGLQTNTVTVAGDAAETDYANNTATAQVRTTGVPSPPEFCVAVSRITPNQLFVGRKTRLTIHVTKHGAAIAGIKVRIKGPKLNTVTARSNAKGVIKKTVKMKKAGILVFSPIASKRCNTKRIGITGVFTPPVTG